MNGGKGKPDGGKPTPKPKPKVVVAKPTGTETVSFKNDIAPFMTNLCLRCHGGNNPRSGFSLETFEKLLQGGDSGRVVLPGNLDGSRLWDLVGKQDPIKMPMGQARIRTQISAAHTEDDLAFAIDQFAATRDLH